MKNRINVHLKKILSLSMCLVLCMTMCLTMAFPASAEVDYKDTRNFIPIMKSYKADFDSRSGIFVNLPSEYMYIMFYLSPHNDGYIRFMVSDTPVLKSGTKFYRCSVDTTDGFLTIINGSLSSGYYYIVTACEYSTWSALSIKYAINIAYKNSSGSVSNATAVSGVFVNYSTSNFDKTSSVYKQVSGYLGDMDLKLISSADTSALESLLAQAKAKQNTGYTDSSWQALQSQITSAENLLATTDYTQEQIDNAKNALQAALDALETLPSPITHTITVIERYTDNAYPEKSTNHEVETGQPFTTNFNIPEGYEVNSVNLFRTGVEVKIQDQTINIEEVTQDMTVTLLFSPKQTETEIYKAAFAGNCTSDSGEYLVNVGGVISGNFDEGVNNLSKAEIMKQNINIFAVNKSTFDTNTMAVNTIDSIQVTVKNGVVISAEISGKVQTPKGSFDTYNIEIEVSSSISPEDDGGDNPDASGVNAKDGNINLADASHRAGVEASSTWYLNEGYGPEKAVDNDTSTRWASADEADDPVTFAVNFKDLYTFNHVLIRSCTDRITHYELQYLKPGTSDEWITFKSGDNLPDDQDVILDDFGEIIGGGIRLVMNRDELAVSIYELQVKYI